MYSEAIMRARGPLLALLGIALLAWAVVAVQPTPPAVIEPSPRAAAAAPLLREIGDLDRASMRLRDGRRPAPQPLAAPNRNPFEFVVVRPKPVAPPKPAEAAAALAALAPLVLPPAPVSLVGLVDREVDGRVVRIAVLSFGGRLHYVEAGSRLGAAYEVVAVGPNAVDLLALDTNTTRRLVQR
jgi:hypothetical protein